MKNSKNETAVGKIIIKTFDAAPENFNPMTASKTTLMRHGIVPKPDADKEPAQYAAWHKVYSKKLTYIIPEFVEKKHKTRKINKNTTRIKSPSVKPAVEFYRNWAGSVVKPPAGNKVRFVSGSWNVPNPNQPLSMPQGTWYYSAAWIGIDSQYLSSDLIQAGTNSDVQVQSDGTIDRNVYAWWEWFPSNNEIAISNFPVMAGDYVTCVICVSDDPPGVTISFLNQSSEAHTSFFVPTPEGVVFLAENAQWILEAPLVDGAQSQLPSYGVVYFDQASAFTEDANKQNQIVLTADKGTNINMSDPTNKLLSETTIEGGQIIQISNWSLIE